MKKNLNSFFVFFKLGYFLTCLSKCTSH